MLTVSSRSR